MRRVRGVRDQASGDVAPEAYACLLLGIPDALQDNGYGTPHGFHAAWTYRAPDVRFSSEPGELPAQTREHLAR